MTIEEFDDFRSIVAVRFLGITEKNRTFWEKDDNIRKHYRLLFLDDRPVLTFNDTENIHKNTMEELKQEYDQLLAERI